MHLIHHIANHGLTRHCKSSQEWSFNAFSIMALYIKKKNYNKNHDEVQSVHSKGELINLCLFSDSSALTAGHSLARYPPNAQCFMQALFLDLATKCSRHCPKNKCAKIKKA